MRAAPVAVAALLAGCGTNRPEIPAELLGSNGDSSLAAGCDNPSYPGAPFGTDPGSTVVNTCFRGWAAPGSMDDTDATLEDIGFGAFYDPTHKHYELLLVNSAALWCAACKAEHATLGQHYADLAPRGLALVSALFQNNAGAPADTDDLKLWVDTFDVKFPMVLDPDYQLGAYASAETAPLNLLVDARTMQIMDKWVGDQSSVIWPTIEDELTKREAGE
ncbi:MAG TPA: hypothetical protein VMI54_23635 [Polyangiaceae bacterium]|nr:hypothetical protein [Polyangiaceae bacterium]